MISAVLSDMSRIYLSIFILVSISTVQGEILDQPYLEAENIDFVHKLISQGKQLVNSSELTFDKVINSSLTPGGGEHNYGLYGISNQSEGNGNRLLKISKEIPFQVKLFGIEFSEKEVQIFQKMESNINFVNFIYAYSLLEKLDLVPKIHGILRIELLSQLSTNRKNGLKSLADLRQDDLDFILENGSAVGIVMDDIGDHVNLTKATIKDRRFFKGWSERKLENSLQDILIAKRRASSAGIHLNDVQFAVTSSGRVYLIDLDRYRYDPENSSFVRSVEAVLWLIEAWEFANDLVFNKAKSIRYLEAAYAGHPTLESDQLKNYFRPIREDHYEINCESFLIPLI